jgi:SAM-dependent methyltransferase
MTDHGPCSLSPDALADRVAAWRDLQEALMAAEPTSTGALLRYRLDRSVADAILDLVEAEGRCCPTLSFETSVTVRVEAPEELRAWVTSTFVPAVAPGRKQRASTVDPAAIVESVRAHYASAAVAPTGCEAAGQAATAGIGPSVYGPDELLSLPAHVVASSIGCANPVAIADLAPGEIVLDLGSGGGTDVLLSAKRVGPTGKAYGLDMTGEMLALARRNQADAGIDNAEFLRGRMEAIPLPDESVDVVLSNCVIGLSPHKSRVFGEAYRVLRRGGRLAVADVVAEAEPTPEERADLESWVSCLAGALTRDGYRAALAAAGFDDVSLEESHAISEGFVSVVIRALKPKGGPGL